MASCTGVGNRLRAEGLCISTLQGTFLEHQAYDFKARKRSRWFMEFFTPFIDNVPINQRPEILELSSIPAELWVMITMAIVLAMRRRRAMMRNLRGS